MPSSTSSSRRGGAPGPLETRLTAADRPGVAQPVPERPVPELPWGKMLLAAAALALLLGGGWEWYWRNYGVGPSYRDDNALWAIQRRQVDTSGQDATVLIGSSRIFFDLQLPVWEQLSGRRPIQLAIAGTSPLSVLEDLADDRAFHGRILVGVAPELFFSGREGRKGWVKYFRQQSPSDRVGKWISMRFVEPHAAFYNSDFALFTVISRQAWPPRPGRKATLEVRKLSQTDADRNTRMWNKVENNPEYRDLARHIWESRFSYVPPTPDEAAENQRTLDTQIARAVVAVAKLRARGVPVLFLREPSADAYLAYEQWKFPSATTWDRLLEKTGAAGIHFQDYPELQGYELPEWSHMTGAEADRFTTALYALVDRQYGRPQGVRW